ncbi:RING-H2 finger protein ATL70-like [Sesamum indicum]|uniref:RING-type E3 ubiquitin transferase n=1 Tax=Sesamum indicum TaxID=4182 RepID=A0A6I9TH55_SESIN|nr:RING-H2 finger protein ATL70-like [Sesamum indicum]
MNTTSNSTQERPDAALGGQMGGGFGYGLALTLAVLIVFMIMTYASYKCKHMQGSATINRPSVGIDTTDGSSVRQIGLDEGTLSSYPHYTYSQVKPHKGEMTASACSICLVDYKDNDVLRLLPECGHLFHLNCVDPWLMLNPTCPICRNSPAHTLLSIATT